MDTSLCTDNRAKQVRYGFYAHLSPEFPSQIVVDVTEYCNLACIHCPHPDFVKSSAFAGRHLDLAIHKKLVNEVATDGKGYCQYLRYTAPGEPLLHPKLVEMITYAGKYSGTAINVTTNGTLLTKEMSKALLDAGVNVFDISIDAHLAHTYAKIRRNGDLSVTTSNVLKLIQTVKNAHYNAKVVVSYVMQPLNWNETQDFKKFWKNSGADYVVIRKLHSCAGSMKEIAEKMKEKAVKRKPCVYPWERLVLSPTGQIGFCPADWKYASKIASLKDVSIKEVWQGEFMKSLRKAHLNNEFPNEGLCKNCPDWSQTKWPDEGRAYSNMMIEFSTCVVP